MRIHKKINIKINEMENSIKHYDLIRRAKRWISDYNKDEDKEIVFTYTGNNSKAIEKFNKLKEMLQKDSNNTMTVVP